jgi:hypothetical protein
LTTLIQNLEMRRAKIGQAIQLLREAGLSDFQGEGYVAHVAAEGQKPTKTGRTMPPEARAIIAEKMKARWAEKKAQGKLMNPKQTPKKPLPIAAKTN